MVPNPPAIRALSQRSGKVYAAADNFGDGYALGTSADEGTTWQALMTYADVKAINPCLKAHCQTTCEAEVMVSLWTADVCAADAPSFDGRGGKRRRRWGHGKRRSRGKRWRGWSRRGWNDAARETWRLRRGGGTGRPTSALWLALVWLAAARRRRATPTSGSS